MSMLSDIKENIDELRTEGKDVCRIVLSPGTMAIISSEIALVASAVNLDGIGLSGRSTLFGIPFRVSPVHDIWGEPCAYVLVS